MPRILLVVTLLLASCASSESSRWSGHPPARPLAQYLPAELAGAPGLVMLAEPTVVVCMYRPGDRSTVTVVLESGVVPAPELPTLEVGETRPAGRDLHAGVDVNGYVVEHTRTLAGPTRLGEPLGSEIESSTATLHAGTIRIVVIVERPPGPDTAVEYVRRLDLAGIERLAERLDAERVLAQGRR